MNVQTYLYFNGNCREAIELYQAALGASVEFLTTYGGGVAEVVPAGWSDKIFHATLRFGSSIINMGDVLRDQPTRFGGFALLAHVDSVDEAERMFACLAEGGVVQMPLQPTPWAPQYGIVTDPFGVTWKVQA